MHESLCGSKWIFRDYGLLSAFGVKSGHDDLTLPCLLMTQSIGLPPPFQSERFCSVTVIDWAYIT